ncbi:hypothetical protein [Burkholderia humptydooensis]|uniref:hypothetical protein n=1 Tax=Burkholderia humptydooensis TaxID=430531 RepID=UPI001CA4A311
MRTQTLQSASSAPSRRGETGLDAGRLALPCVDVRSFPAKNLACCRRTLDWPADCLEIESRAIVRAGASGLPADRPLTACGCRLFACVTARRHPAPNGNAPVMPRCGRRAEILRARRPAGKFLLSARRERRHCDRADAPERHRRLAVFRSDDFDRAIAARRVRR